MSAVMPALKSMMSSLNQAFKSGNNICDFPSIWATEAKFRVGVLQQENYTKSSSLVKHIVLKAKQDTSYRPPHKSWLLL